MSHDSAWCHFKRFFALLWEEVGIKVVTVIVIAIGLLGPAMGIGWGIACLCEKPFAPGAFPLTVIGLAVWAAILFLLLLCAGAFFWLLDKWDETKGAQP